MRPKLLIPALAGALLAMTGCDFEEFGNVGHYSRDFHYSYPLKSGGRVSVETFNGSVEITPWDQDTVDISGTKYGPTQDAADNLKVSIDNSPDSVSIRVSRPYERRNNQGARFAIKVPRKASVDRITTSNGAIRIQDTTGTARLKTSNGSIRVQGLQGTLDAETSNGSVELFEIDGDVSAHSSNGHIKADHIGGSFDATTSNSSVTAVLERPDRGVRVGTSNGSIDLTVPGNLHSDLHANTNNSSITLHFNGEPDAHVVAQTSNGTITSDFDMKVRGEIRRNHMDAVLGGGGATIDLGTSNGNIRLLRR